MLHLEDGQLCFDSRLLEDIRQQRHEEALKIIKTHRNAARCVDSLSKTLLHYAAEHDCHEVVAYLINVGADIDAQDSYGDTALMLAANDCRSREILLRKYTSLHLGEVDGRNTSASLFENKPCSSSILQQLLEEHFGDIDQVKVKLVDLKYPAYSVVHLDDPQLTRYLLANGCPVVPIDISTLTPVDALVRAMKLNSLENVKILLDFVADVNVKSIAGSTILYECGDISTDDRDEHTQMLRLLLERGADYRINVFGEMSIVPILLRGSRRHIRMLLDSMSDVNYQDDSGRNVLHYLVQNCSYDGYEDVEGRGIDVNVRDNSGWTPLHCAHRLSLHPVRFLLDNGANVNAQINDGITPLRKLAFPTLIFGQTWEVQHIVEQRENQMTEYLLHQGADVHLGYYQGTSIFSNKIMLRTKLHRRPSVCAHVALIEARGAFIEDFIRREIDADYELQRHYEMAKEQLEEMKGVRVRRFLSSYLSLYDLMIDSEYKIELYVRNQRFLQNMRRFDYQNKYLPYYCYVLRDRLLKATQIMRLRKMNARILCEAIGWHDDMYELALNKIIINVSRADLRKMH